jgi:formamidopyrimidine-DNA glycosylase
MPELPEVEHGARTLSAATAGRTIESVRLLHPVYVRMLPAAGVARIVGRTVTGVTRRGKYQLIALDDGGVLSVHFGMTGEWMIGRRDDPEDRFARLVLDFSDGTRATLSDSRALGRIHFYPLGSPLMPELGPEPLGPAFSPESLGVALRHRRGLIKPALLDQRVVAGLGNIYAAEALWLARISPRAVAASLSSERRTRLVRSIRQVLRHAPAARYYNAAASSGKRRDADSGALAARDDRARGWRVYDREGKACKRCGARITRITQAGRSTYYCPHCQRR